MGLNISTFHSSKIPLIYLDVLLAQQPLQFRYLLAGELQSSERKEKPGRHARGTLGLNILNDI